MTDETIPEPQNTEAEAPAETPAPRRVAINAWGVPGPLATGSTCTVTVALKDLGGVSLAGLHLALSEEIDGAMSSCDVAVEEGSEAKWQGTLTLNATTLGHHEAVFTLTNAQGEVIAQKKMPYSVIPVADRTITVKVTCTDDNKPVPGSLVFAYNSTVQGTGPVKVRANDEGVATVPVSKTSAYVVRVPRGAYIEGRATVEPGDDNIEIAIAVPAAPASPISGI